MQLAEERRQHIVDTVEQQGKVLAAELAQRFNTSEDTIRRDLRDLDAAGLLRRVHGGAMRRTQPVPSFGQRVDADEARKDRLARALADSVQPGDTVLVDAGTTNLAFARQLEDGRAATIITNSPQIALGLGHFGDLIDLFALEPGHLAELASQLDRRLVVLSPRAAEVEQPIDGSLEVERA